MGSVLVYIQIRNKVMKDASVHDKSRWIDIDMVNEKRGARLIY